MADASAARTLDTEEKRDHLRSIDAPAKRKFSAIDHEVLRVLGPHRSPALIYGYLASAWFEFASADALKAMESKTKRAKTPGDWVSVAYSDLMPIVGTNSRNSITRWIRVLAEDEHECPWGRCATEHPLIVGERLGRSRPNRYRRWKCGEDILVVRQRVRSQKLKEAAQARSGMNGFTNLSSDDVLKTHDRSSENVALPFEDPSTTTLKTYDGSSKSNVVYSYEDPHTLEVKTCDRSSRRPTVALPEDPRRVHVETHDGSSLRVNTPNTLKTTAKEPNHAAAVEKSDEVDAVACEVVDAIVALAQRVESSYRDDQAWSVARRLAPVAISLANGNSAGARHLLLTAIGDRRIARASNPVGLLIRGIIGDEQGNDRFLIGSTSAALPGSTPQRLVVPPKVGTDIPAALKSALLDALRSGRAITAEWLRERDIPAHELVAARKIVQAERLGEVSATPLSDCLENTDPTAFMERLDETARTMKPPTTLERLQEHPIIAKICRAALEADLRKKSSPENHISSSSAGVSIHRGPDIR